MSARLGDVVVLDSGYTPKHNGVPAPIVRTYVSMTRDRSACGRARCDHLCNHCGKDGPYWSLDVELVELRVGEKLVEAADFELRDPLSRRGLIARLGRDNADAQKRRASQMVGREARQTSIGDSHPPRVSA